MKRMRLGNRHRFRNICVTLKAQFFSRQVAKKGKIMARRRFGVGSGAPDPTREPKQYLTSIHKPDSELGTDDLSESSWARGTSIYHTKGHGDRSIE